MRDLWKLVKVQKVDLEIFEKQKEKKSLDSGEALLARINQAAEKTDRMKQEIEKYRKKIKDFEYKMQAYDDNIKKIEKDLYGGRNTNPKELMNWQQEAEHIKTQKKQIEEEMLKIMEDVEAADKKVRVADELIEKARGDYEKAAQDYKLKIAGLDGEIAQIEQKKKDLLEGVDEDDVNQYEQLRLRKDGLAIVKIEGSCCGGCFMNLPANLIDKARHRETIHCGNCGRLLYCE